MSPVCGCQFTELHYNALQNTQHNGGQIDAKQSEKHDTTPAADPQVKLEKDDTKIIKSMLIKL